MVETLLEAQGRGYADLKEEDIEKLQEIYAEIDDRIELSR